MNWTEYAFDTEAEANAFRQGIEFEREEVPTIRVEYRDDAGEWVVMVAEVATVQGDWEDDEEPEWEPQDDDIFIPWNSRPGVYEAYYARKPIAEAEDFDSLLAEIKSWMEKSQYWPNVWVEGERGGYDLVNLETGEYMFYHPGVSGPTVGAEPGMTADGEVSTDPNDWPSEGKIEEIFRKGPEFQAMLDPTRVEVFWEHDQYWIRIEDEGYDANDSLATRTFSVVAANPGVENSGIDFEEV